MEYRWELKLEVGHEKVKSLSEQLNQLNPVLTELLIQRNIDSFEKAKDFFRPSLSTLNDPFLMKDMDRAVDRLQTAIQSEEKILIYGDYDVDGVTSVSTLYSFLSEDYTHLGYYIPDRYAEGYGISYLGIDYAAEHDFSLVIALDCGIKANDQIDYANEKGIDFIICDHHRPGEKLPEAIAILDPKRQDCSYPYKELSGCGVGFKLIQAFSNRNNLGANRLEKCLDFLAISIAADIVPITGENRVLAHFGLRKINENPNGGVQTMLDLLGLKKSLTITDVVFKLAPRINAAGRLKSATKAVELLISNEVDGAFEKGKYIDGQNEDRKKLDEGITKQALELIEKDASFYQKKSTVVFKEDWHKGVIGIVASRLIEKHYRPTVVLTKSNGKATGSARSVKGFDVYNAIDACSDLLEQYGGHKYAAGLTLSMDQLDAFKQRFDEVVQETISEEHLIPKIEIDKELKLQEIDGKFFRVLQQMAPFGPGNNNPVFLSKQVLSQQRRLLGEKHLKLKLFDPQLPSRVFEAIGFGMGDFYHQIDDGIPIDIVYSLELNEWNGRSTLQLNLKDIKL